MACKKDYDCTCSYNNGTSVVSETYDVGKTSEEDADTHCATQKTSLESSGGTEVTCATAEK